MSSATASMLKRAVHHHKPTSRRGSLERLFTAWFKGFVYNQIWEDPRVDATALQMGSHSRILTISSGGCNVLNYLRHQPQRIVAVDLNACHMCLTRLKLTAVEHLPSYEDFFNFFGLGNKKSNLANYYNYISEHLDPDTRRFWETSSWPGRKIGPRRIRYFARGIYDHSKLGMFLRFAHTAAKVTRRNPHRLLEMQTRQEQEQFFDDVIAPFFDNRVVRWLTRQPMTVFSLGIPPSQHKVMSEESAGRIVELYRERVRKLTCDFPMDDNYFAWQAFGRRYDHENRRALPDYLREENFQLMREGVNRVETDITTLADFLRTQPDNALNNFILLDSQDWMPPQVITELWTEIARVGEPGSRIIFRTAGEVSPVEAALPEELRSRFVYEQDLARELHAQDRSAIYGGFHIYSMPQ
jgi:S-adenosylmethionine-diacylglycerol 3-amino-3-carboxypropyl transferase